jgi:hypothetical protein
LWNSIKIISSKKHAKIMGSTQHNSGHPVFWKESGKMPKNNTARGIWIFALVTSVGIISAEISPSFSCPSKFCLPSPLPHHTSPVCSRVIKASRELSTDKPSKLFEKYCSLSILSNEEQQFCYNSQGFQSEISRLLDLGADEKRICKRIYKINPDFCTIRSFPRHTEDHSQRSQEQIVAKETTEINATSGAPSKAAYPRKRGVIYE